MEVALFIVAAVGLVTLAAVFSHRAQQKRMAAIQAFAAAHGLSFNPARDARVEDQFPEFACFRQGSNRYGYNFFRGPWKERPLLAFDYHYETYSTDSKGRRSTHHHHFSCVLLDPGIPLRPLTVRPEGVFDKLAGFFGFDDIDFESAEFSKRFHVKAPDRKWAYDVLHARAIEFIMAQPPFEFEFSERQVLIKRNRRMSLDEFAQAAHFGTGLLDQFPPYLVEQQRSLWNQQ